MKKTLLATVTVSLLLPMPLWADFAPPDSANLQKVADNTTSMDSNFDKLIKGFGFGESAISNAVKEEIISASARAVFGLFSNLPLPTTPVDGIRENSLKLIPSNRSDTFATLINDTINFQDLFKSGNSYYSLGNGLNTGKNAIRGVDQPHISPVPRSTVMADGSSALEYMNTPSSQLLYNLIAGRTPGQQLQVSTAYNDSDNQGPADSTLIAQMCGANGSCNANLVLPVDKLAKVSGGVPPITKLPDSPYATSYIPDYNNFMDGTLSASVAPSVNADTLLSPMTYQEKINQTYDNRNDTISFYGGGNLGLYGSSELSMADNFIRYLSGEVLPNKMSTAEEYKQYQKVANTAQCYKYRADAAMKIYTYRAMLRNYAAQTSVGLSNLYYLMGKRRQNPENPNNASQLEQEYKMATSRLFPANQCADGSTSCTVKKSKWLLQLDNASQVEVQKQIAILLAEMNYQLLLNRMEQERVMLAMTALQMANTAQQKQQLTLDNAASYISNIPTGQVNQYTKCDQYSVTGGGG